MTRVIETEIIENEIFRKSFASKRSLKIISDGSMLRWLKIPFFFFSNSDIVPLPRYNNTCRKKEKGKGNKIIRDTMFQTNAGLFLLLLSLFYFIYFLSLSLSFYERKKNFNHTRTGNLIIKYISRYQGFIGRIDSVCQCQCITYAHRSSQIDVAFAPIPSRLNVSRPPPPHPDIAI